MPFALHATDTSKVKDIIYTGDTRYLQVPMKLNEFFNSVLVSLPKGGFDDSKETFTWMRFTIFRNITVGRESESRPAATETLVSELLLIFTISAKITPPAANRRTLIQSQ